MGNWQSSVSSWTLGARRRPEVFRCVSAVEKDPASSQVIIFINALYRA